MPSNACGFSAVLGQAGSPLHTTSQVNANIPDGCTLMLARCPVPVSTLMLHWGSLCACLNTRLAPLTAHHQSCYCSFIQQVYIAGHKAGARAGKTSPQSLSYVAPTTVLCRGTSIQHGSVSLFGCRHDSTGRSAPTCRIGSDSHV